MQSLGTVDGPGIRAVVFGDGCPLRCAYCHNPDTWELLEEHLIDSELLVNRILRLKPYLKNGGVTFSGGEPCLQAEFFYKVATVLKENGLHIALDTCGEIDTPGTDLLLTKVDLVLLDIKMTTENDYRQYTGGSLTQALSFLDKLERLQKDVWIRHVVVPTVNDSKQDIQRLSALLAPYSCIKKVELLPFKKLCLEKYQRVGIPFPLQNTPPASSDLIAELEKYL